jgi:hypothetical protein
VYLIIDRCVQQFRGHVIEGQPTIASFSHGHLSYLLNQFERGDASLLTNHITKQAAQEANVIGNGTVLVCSRHHH